MTSPTPRRAKHDTPRPHNRGGGHLTTPPTASAPLRRGELVMLSLQAKFPSIGGVAACRRGGKRVQDWALTPPLSSRAERGDPVNKKALRAFARRHNDLYTG